MSEDGLGNMKRQLRRHHYERLKRNRYAYWGGDSRQLSEKSIGIITRTPHPCSCYSCGNPRKHFNEMTRRESESELKFQEQLAELSV